MRGYIVSFYNKILKVSLVGTDKEVTKKLDASNFDTKIVAEELGQLIVEKFGPKPPKEPLNFLIDPKELILNFITKTKENSESNDFLENEVRTKLKEKGTSTENVYYSYQKIAPFVHQFVAIKKDLLEKYLVLANDLELELNSVLAWPLLLPKKTGSSGDAAIFVLKMGADHLLILSEMGGIYYSGLIDKTKVEDGLEELITKLSVYNRDDPINKIYTFGVDSLSLSGKYQISKIEERDSHKLVESLVQNEDILETQVNLLRLLPVPEKARKISPAVITGVAAFLLVTGGFFIYSNFGSITSDNTQLAQNDEGPPVVLSEVEESTESVDEEAEDVNSDLNKTYLRVRIENGTLVGGLAGKTRDSLVEFEYDVVSVGDFEETNVEVTKVRFNKSNAIYEDMLKNDLLELFNEVEVGDFLEDELEYDVLIIAGTNEINEE